ncbi:MULTISPECIES: GNAT family N-acetyltransferase [Sinorhizobium]|uniref:Ribosomal-protein-alanine acetyltransferase n=1 Tax=Sinorhizobium americanum TaxID=194963 RepID=A0A2S3YL28_9HYPH|nr:MULTISPECIES: N-acetyltransferase [Sinorhizobium]PDT41873.1 ribosomal-protein-alanine acetyltransferase [Sinorhizobium sp. FG01]PDT53854.1 ribosomal-protein-alanine acetyltransferase [Sinorhizobium sp. NG07B]POH28685.1 ribosomal-protein-alanine acetyltransferase [Sinorhizobium americanum]POH30914.1 ribosomal-protein-alanine acetyltransferase [Sinorhizobium americanum]
MSFTDYFTRRTEFDIFPLEEADLIAAATLHSQRFAKPWSDGEIHALLLQETVFGFAARQTNGTFRPAFGGFVLSRAAAGEAEVLSIGVDPRFARSGLGWRLMQAVMREAIVKGAETLFLEVDEANLAAIGLYGKLGFAKVGERKAYYQGAGGSRTAALVMRLDLR